MRSKRFLALCGLAFTALLVTAPAAAAQEDGEAVEEEREHLSHEIHEFLERQDAHHADIDCVDLILEGQSVDDCRDAPNPLLPETNEIIWGGIGFVVVFLFLARVGGPAIKKAMADRAEKIQGDLDAAETARTEAEAVKSGYESQLADARSESARIIEEARQAADQLRTDQQARLNDELSQARDQAQADIDAAKSQAMAELRGEVADIAIGAAEAVVGANLDRAAQTRLVEDYIESVQSTGANGNAS